MQPGDFPHNPRMPLVRPLEATDSIDELTELLHRAYARLGDMGLNYTAVDQSPQVTRERIRGATCFVAVADDGADAQLASAAPPRGAAGPARRLIGTITVHHTSADPSEAYYARAGVAAAHQFAVDPSQQGAGIGRMLLQRAEQWAVEQGYREIAVDTAEQATHLIDLYARLGYRHVGFVQWHGKVYRSVIMSKPLHSPAHR
jgi:GNAT superfamily N-acetyltransferase